MSNNTLSLVCIIAGLTLSSPAVLAQTAPVDDAEKLTIQEAAQSDDTRPEAVPQATYGDQEQAVAEPEQQTLEPVPEGTFIRQQDENQLLTEDLKGLEVMGGDGEAIAEIDDLLLDDQGRLQGVVVDTGSFMGIGGRKVALDWTQLNLTTDPDGEQVIQTDLTQQQLENAPEFQGREESAGEPRQAGQGERITATVSAVDPQQQTLTLDTEQGQVQLRLPEERLAQYQEGDQVVVQLNREGGTMPRVEPQEESEQARFEPSAPAEPAQ